MKARLFFLMVICMVSVGAFAADGRKPAGEEKRLSAGTVTVYDFGKVRLHAYNTGDAMADAAFLVEGKKAVVGIELPSFDVNLAEWKAYADSLGKPMNDIIISDHAAGGAYVRDVRVWGTDGARKSVESGAANGITAQLFHVYGPEFRGEELARIANILHGGKNKVAGIDFVVFDRGSSFDVAIPAADAIYTHMLGKYVHSIIGSRADASSLLETLRSYQKGGYRFILSSHAGVEGQDAVSEKIAYVEKLMEFAGTAESRAEFVQAAEAAFPGYEGKNYLEMTAAAFFPE